MLQNRVDPIGNIIKTKARGAWMGTRGLIHDDQQNLVRPYKLKAWITCVLQFKNRRRKVMSPGLYTELFFLDEATAFAAGHRPCAECRRPDFNLFKECWIKGNPEYGFNMKTRIAEIDDVLHRERIDKNNLKQTHEAKIADCPDGSFVLLNDEPYLLTNHLLYLWTPFGYEKTIAVPKVNKVTVLTPQSVINAFRSGYVPQTAIK